MSELGINSPKLTDPFVESADFLKYLKKVKTLEEIKIVYFGTPEFSAYILERLIEFSNEPSTESVRAKGNIQIQPKFIVQTVVTNPDKPVGRKQEVRESAVSKVAAKYGIPVLKVEKLDEDFIKDNLSQLESDLFIVVSYGKIIPQKMLSIPRLGAINIHGSILPKYRGASPIQQAILNGDRETGITTILMDEKMDHGPILSVKSIKLSNQENYLTLSNKMMVESANLLIKTMQEFVVGRIKPRGQRHAKSVSSSALSSLPKGSQAPLIASYCNLIKKEDGYFDINNPPPLEKLDRMIRAYYPWPTAWTVWEREKEKKIVKFFPGGMVQMEGKKAVKLEEFLRGYPDFPIKNLTF